MSYRTDITGSVAIITATQKKKQTNVAKLLTGII